MPELDLSYDPEWMHQKASEQPMSLAEAFQLRQRQQQLNMNKATLPLQMQEMQANIANAALDHTIKQEQIHVALKHKAADSAIWSKIAGVNNYGDLNQWKSVIEQWSQTPGSADTMKFIEAGVKSGQQGNDKLDQMETRLRFEALKASKEPTSVDVENRAYSLAQRADAYAATGDTVNEDIFRKRSEVLLGTLKTPSGSTDSTRVKDAKERLSALKDALAKSGGAPMTPGEEAVKYQQLVDEQTALPNEETKVELGPGGTVQSITTHRGAGKTGPTVATESKAQTDLMRYQGVVQLLENMTSQLRPQDVGIAGKIGSFQNRILGQIGLGGDMEVSSNRAQAEGTLTDFLQSQLLRGRIRETDVVRLRKAFIDPASASQSYDQIMSNAGEMKNLVKMEAITTAKGPGGQALQPWMFIGLTTKNLFNLVQTGLLTKKEAHDWAERVNPPIQ